MQNRSLFAGLLILAALVHAPPAIASVPYARSITAASVRYGVDAALIAAVIQTESGFRRDARNARTGATGLMQLLSGTARDLGLRVDPKRDDRLDPHKNIMAGTRYLGQQLKWAEGDVPTALAAYHAGPVHAAMYGVPPMSRAYVANVQRRALSYRRRFSRR